MELKINVTITNYSDILVEDITDYSQIELSNINQVTVLEKVKDSSLKTIINNPSIEFKNNKDGYYKVYYLLIPSENTVINDESINTYILKDNIIYKQTLEGLQEVNLLEILKVNLLTSNIFRTEENVFISSNLKKCYINYCKNVELNICQKENLDTFNKNLVWITLNIINYLVEFDLFTEADNLIYLIESCYGICKSRDRGSDTNECGCS